VKLFNIQAWMFGTKSDTLNVGPTMLTFALCDVVKFEEDALPREEHVDNNYNVTWKDGCFIS
jgi:hypothetical protein